MIRTTLNLARRPAENLRRLRLVWGGSLALLFALLLALSATAYLGWRASRPIQAQTDQVRARIAALLADPARVRAADPGLRDALDQSAFFNQLIDRKAVSWTLLFERLEQIMPPGAELVSLRPLQRDGASAVDIRFASNTLPPAIDFVRQLESAPDFADARVERETEAAPPALAPNPRTQPPPRFQIEVTALYRGGSQPRGSQ